MGFLPRPGTPQFCRWYVNPAFPTAAKSVGCPHPVRTGVLSASEFVITRTVYDEDSMYAFRRMGSIMGFVLRGRTPRRAPNNQHGEATV